LALRIDWHRPALGRALGLEGIRAIVRDADAALKLSLRADTVTIGFVPAGEMRALKREHLGLDRATDVLSFPAPVLGLPGPRPLGDIILCPDYLAPRFPGAKLPRRARQLVLHGLLHLVGFDHETDAGEMNRLERKLRRQLGIG
jgi:probable rRNA maturation factor